MEFNVILFYLPLRPYSFNESNYTFDYIASELSSVLEETKMLKRVSIIGEEK